MTRFALIAALALGGCATEQVQSYTPFVPKSEMRDAQAFKDDLVLCRADALEYLDGQSSLDPSAVASATGQGAASNLGSLAVSPAAVALSGLGGGSGEVMGELGLTATSARKVVAICMATKGKASGAYTVMDPSL